MSSRRRHHPDLFNDNFAFQTAGVRTSGSPRIDLRVNGSTLFNPYASFTLGLWFYPYDSDATPNAWPVAGTTLVAYMKSSSRELFRITGGGSGGNTLIFQWSHGDYIASAANRGSLTLGTVNFKVPNFVGLSFNYNTEIRARLNNTVSIYNTVPANVKIYEDTASSLSNYGVSAPIDNNSHNLKGFCSYFFNIQAALTDAQLAAIYGAGRATTDLIRNHAQLMRYLPLNNTQGITTPDLGPYSQQASISGNYVLADTELGGFHWSEFPL